MNAVLKNKKNLGLFLIPVLFGVVIFWVLLARKKPPVRVEQQATAIPVRVVEAISATFRPTVLGYGTVRPQNPWRMVAEVPGKIVFLHPAFEEGAFVEAGTVLLKIDPAEYELAVRRQAAQVALVEAQRQQLQQEQRNLDANLALEKRNLKLVERELQRQVALVGNGAVSETMMEQTERDRLRSQLSLKQLENQQALFPSRAQQLEAQLEQAKVALDDAKRRLAQTEIRLNFNGRVAAKAVEYLQPVAVGAVLGEIHGTAAVEIRAEISLSQWNRLQQETPLAGKDQASNRSGLTARVRLKNNHNNWVWPAEVRHIAASLDPATRAVGVIVTVTQPYASQAGSSRPALMDGMFCEVELRGPPRRGVLIPRVGQRGQQVAVAGPDNLLELRNVTLGTAFGEVVEVVAGLAAGEQLVVSDLNPSVQGSALEPVRDEAMQQMLHAAQEGVTLP